MRTTLKSHYPTGWHLFAVLTTVSSLLIPLELHRGFYALLDGSSIPRLMVAALTGMMNLSWFELAYITGMGLSSVQVFTLLPFVGSATGLLSVFLLFTSSRWRRQVLFAHLAFGWIIAAPSLTAILWRGMDDDWRLVSIAAFLLTYTAWILYFLWTRQYFSRV